MSVAEKISFDFETQGTEELSDVGAYKYAIHHETRALMLAYNLTGNPYHTKIWTFRDPAPVDLFNYIAANPYKLLSGFNVPFEYLIWNLHCVPRLGWPSLPLARVTCSAAKCRAYTFPNSLEKVAPALRLVKEKDKRGKELINLFSKPQTRGKFKGQLVDINEYPNEFQEFIGYCIQDVNVEMEVDRTVPDLTEDQRRVWLMTEKLNLRGVAIDTDTLPKAIEAAEVAKDRANHLIYLLTCDAKDKGDIVERATQRDRLIRYLKYNLNFELNNTKEETLRKLLDRKGIAGTKIALLIQYVLQAKKSSVSKLENMKTRLTEDNLVRELLLYHGARTGRYAGRGIQIQNFPRPSLSAGKTPEGKKVEVDYEYVIQKIQEGDLDVFREPPYNSDPLAVVVSALRSVLVTRPGYTFYAADYAQIECRVLLWLADEWEGLNLFASGECVYTDMAATIYGKTYEELKALGKESLERLIGKTAILGLGYQMGIDRFLNECIKQGIPMDRQGAEKIVTAYRNKYWKVKQLWYALNDAAMEATYYPGKVVYVSRVAFQCDCGYLFCYLPSGRRIAYPNPNVWPEEKKWGVQDSIFFEQTVGNGWASRSTYGGKLCENVTQAIAADLLKSAMLRVETRGFNVVLSVHDEIVAEYKGNPEPRKLEEYQRLMEVLPYWAKGLPIETEGWLGKRFRK